tara:strand:- start:695 stop:1156 length:462 start_codon:yes stop_codon:yes gene_type:complete
MAKIPKVPEKYTAGLKESTAAKRKAEIRKRVRGEVKGKAKYKPLPGDKKAKTKTSPHTKRAGSLRKRILETATKKKGSQTDRFIKAVSTETGISTGIIRDVYERGLAAWAVGHRPGTTAAQWARARVYSFITGGKTTRTADAGLYAKARKQMK